MDEVTSQQDGVNESKIFELLRDISKQTPVILVSHSAEAPKYADQTVHFHSLGNFTVHKGA